MMISYDRIIVCAIALALVVRCLFLERRCSRSEKNLAAADAAFSRAIDVLRSSVTLLERLAREKNGRSVPVDVWGNALSFGQVVQFSLDGRNLSGMVDLNIKEGVVDEENPLCIVCSGRHIALDKVQGLTVTSDIEPADCNE